MKRSFALPLIIALACAFSSCALQKEMTPEIFIERLCAADKRLTVDFENRYYINDRCYCFVKDEGMTEYILVMHTCENGSIKTVSVTSTETDKCEAFISFAEKITDVYSPADDSNTVLKNVFLNGEMPKENVVYNTRWHEYSALSNDYAMYFSIDDLSLGERTVPELTLGDLSGYMNKAARSSAMTELQK